MEYRISGFCCDNGERHPVDGRLTVESESLGGVLSSSSERIGRRGIDGCVLAGDPLYFLFHLMPPAVEDIYFVLRHSFARDSSLPSVEGRCYGFWLDANQADGDWPQALVRPEYSAIDSLYSSTAPRKEDRIVDCKLKPSTGQSD